MIADRKNKGKERVENQKLFLNKEGQFRRVGSSFSYLYQKEANDLQISRRLYRFLLNSVSIDQLEQSKKDLRTMCLSPQE